MHFVDDGAPCQNSRQMSALRGMKQLVANIFKLTTSTKVDFTCSVRLGAAPRLSISALEDAAFRTKLSCPVRCHLEIKAYQVLSSIKSGSAVYVSMPFQPLLVDAPLCALRSHVRVHPVPQDTPFTDLNVQDNFRNILHICCNTITFSLVPVADMLVLDLDEPKQKRMLYITMGDVHKLLFVWLGYYSSAVLADKADKAACI